MIGPPCSSEILFGCLIACLASSTGVADTSFPAQPTHGAEDNGLNVLLDHAHQFQFFSAWDVPPLVRQGGFRLVGSQASLHTVLMPGKHSRVRIGGGKHRPFGTFPNPDYHVVISYQTDPNAQAYLPEEIDALLRFVQEGGGLLLMGGGIHSPENTEIWPLNALTRELGARITSEAASAAFTSTDDPLVQSLELPEQGRIAGLELTDDWETLISGADGTPILAKRGLGQGRVILMSDQNLIRWGAAEDQKANAPFLHGLLHWVAAGKAPSAGSRHLPSEAWGGGAIYPELQADIGGITVWYAANQKATSLEAVREDMPQMKAHIESWLPSIPPAERMHLILASGGGGGWAVNVYQPKEVGIIALEPHGILSVFAHELAHTMAGPPNGKGKVAGRLPWLFSEAHAGWFQGKVEAVMAGNRGGHEPNRLFEIDPDDTAIDLATLEDTSGQGGKGWQKLWWLWQKLDDRYGPTWYPRWLWIKSVRWQDEPDHALSWDDVVEEMSVAVGEDLFPFFHAIGTTLQKERLAETTFLGERLQLPIADIAITPGGTAKLEPVGDYRQPLDKQN